MRACTSCGRTLGKVAVRCLYCGTAAPLAPEATASARKPVLVTCPGCLRNARIAPGTTGNCSYCALAFHVDDDGGARLGRGAGTAAATRADVDRLVADLPAARLWDVVRDVLHRRAAFDELAVGEAERAIDALTAIATWDGDSPYWLPLPLAEAVALVPRVVFGVSDASTLPDDGGVTLLMVLGLRTRMSGPGGRAAVNLLGIASSMAIGVGFSDRDQDRVNTSIRVQIRSDLVEHHGGTALTRRANQIDQEAPTPLDETQEGEIRERIAASRGLLAGYYIAGALFGPSCRGGTAFSLTRDAIAQRLAALGCDQAPELVDQLHIRTPPVFGSV